MAKTSAEASLGGLYAGCCQGPSTHQSTVQLTNRPTNQLTAVRSPQLDPHNLPLEPPIARGVELLGSQGGLDRLHRFVDGAQVAVAPCGRIDRFVASQLEAMHETTQ